MYISKSIYIIAIKLIWFDGKEENQIISSMEQVAADDGNLHHGYHQRFFFIGSIYLQKKSLKCWKVRSSQVTLISLNVSAWKVKHARYCSRKVSIRIVRFWQYRIDCKSLHFHWLRWIRDNLLCTFKNHKPERHDANVPSF